MTVNNQKTIDNYRETIYLMVPNADFKISDDELLERWGAGEYKAKDLSFLSGNSLAYIFIPYLTFKTLEKAYVLRNFINKTHKDISIDIILGYVSYSRQERETANEPALLPNILDSLNVLLLDSEHREKTNIYVIDGHNKKSFTDKGVINKSALIYLHDRSMVLLDFNMSNSIIVAPDKGAKERNEEYGIPTGLVLEKHRSNGQVKTKFPDDFRLPSKSINHFVILDDICDGGRTFANAAELIKERYPDAIVILVVTHAILPFGVQLLKEKGIDKIITSNTCLPQGEHYDGFVEAIDVRDRAVVWTLI